MALISVYYPKWIMSTSIGDQNEYDKLERELDARLSNEVYTMWLRATDTHETLYGENMSVMARDLGMPQSSLYRTLRPNLDVKEGTLRGRLIKLAEALDRRGRTSFAYIVDSDYAGAPWLDAGGRVKDELRTS